jgi:hypothetical protein
LVASQNDWLELTVVDADNLRTDVTSILAGIPEEKKSRELDHWDPKIHGVEKVRSPEETSSLSKLLHIWVEILRGIRRRVRFIPPFSVSIRQIP